MDGNQRYLNMAVRSSIKIDYAASSNIFKISEAIYNILFNIITNVLKTQLVLSSQISFIRWSPHGKKISISSSDVTEFGVPN